MRWRWAITGRFLLTLTGACAGACGGGKPADALSPNAPRSSGSSVERYFPLEDGRIYHYVTSDNGEPGMLVARAVRKEPSRGELRLSNAIRRFVYTTDGVAYEGGAYILKAPLEVGASWPGEHGGTTHVQASDASSTVAAGAYVGCVQTVEEGGRPPGSRYRATYCPGVGIVLLEVQVGAGEARAELKSYGLPVKIE